MQNLGVIVAGEDKAGAAHIGGELVDLVEAAVDHRTTKSLVPEVADREVIGQAFRIARQLQIDPPDPQPLLLQALHQVAANKAAGPQHQC